MKTFDLDNPLMEFVSKNGRVPYSIRMACEGIFIAGSIGSGKSSGSARFLALKLLKANFGGLVLTAKNSEKTDWIEYCRLTGRGNDLLIIEPGSYYKFNFLQYLASNKSGTGMTENIVDVLKTVIEAGQDANSGRHNDEFWSNSLYMVLFFSVQLSKMAYGTVTIELLNDICQSLPKGGIRISPEKNEAPSAFYKAYKLVTDKAKADVLDWREKIGPDRLKTLYETGQYDKELYDALPELRQVKQLDDFFIDTLRSLNEKTRSIIDFTISAFLFRLLQEPVFSLFCNGISTIKPELCSRGKIILVNLPVKEFHKIGRDCQIMMKLIFQRAMEKRPIKENTQPVFLFADEAQLFLHPHDTDFQATARSSRIITCFITQNLPNLFASMGGHRPEDRVNAFLSTLGTKFFHSNSCIETNRYASDLVGEAFMPDYSESITYSQNPNQSRGKSLKLQKIMRPEDFINLKTGSKVNNHLVEGIIHCQGNAKFRGSNHMKVTFNQNYKP